MNRMIWMMTFVFGMMIGVGAMADEVQTVAVTLQLPATYVSQVCPLPTLKGQRYVWKGVVDNRESKVLGVQTKKDVVTAQVIANPTLESYVSGAIATLLEGCGATLVKDEEATELSVDINEFYVGVKKGFITGKSEGTAKMGWSIMKPTGISASVEIEHSLESKKMKSRDIKQLTQTLNTLLIESLDRLMKVSELKM